MAQPGPFDIGGNANSLADAIRAQAANQASQAKTKKKATSSAPNSGSSSAPQSALDQLMQQINNISVPSTPYDQLLSQATGSASAQYDPLIQQLQGQIASTTSRGKGNEQQAKQMYGDLANDIAGELPGITNTMNQATQDTQSRYDDAQGQLKQQYDSQAAAQAALYKKLGIQAAAPDATQQQSDDQSYFQGQSKLDEQSALDALSQMKQSDVSYNKQSSDNTRLAGDNAAQAIGGQLEDYLQQANGQLSGLNASKQGSIQQMLAQLQQQDSQRVQTGETQQYSQLMDMFNLQLKMQQMQDDEANSAAKNAQSGQLFKGTNGPQGAANYLGGIYGNNSFDETSIMDALNDVMSSPAAVAGKYQDPSMKDSYGNASTLDVTPQYLADQLRTRLQSGDPKAPLSSPQFNNSDINNAINALYAYMGQLK